MMMSGNWGRRDDPLETKWLRYVTEYEYAYEYEKGGEGKRGRAGIVAE
jgi:hypothetical protein